MEDLLTWAHVSNAAVQQLSSMLENDGDSYKDALVLLLRASSSSSLAYTELNPLSVFYALPTVPRIYCRNDQAY